jgi:hypothetical protein
MAALVAICSGLTFPFNVVRSCSSLSGGRDPSGPRHSRVYSTIFASVWVRFKQQHQPTTAGETRMLDWAAVDKPSRATIRWGQARLLPRLDPKPTAIKALRRLMREHLDSSRLGRPSLVHKLGYTQANVSQC